MTTRYVERLIDFNHEMMEPLQFHIDEDIHYKREELGMQADGYLYLSGKYRSHDGIRLFQELLEVDILAPLDKLTSPEAFCVSVKDYDYSVKDGDLLINICIEIMGLQEDAPQDEIEEAMYALQEEIMEETALVIEEPVKVIPKDLVDGVPFVDAMVAHMENDGFDTSVDMDLLAEQVQALPQNIEPAMEMDAFPNPLTMVEKAMIYDREVLFDDISYPIESYVTSSELTNLLSEQLEIPLSDAPSEIVFHLESALSASGEWEMEEVDEYTDEVLEEIEKQRLAEQTETKDVHAEEFAAIENHATMAVGDAWDESYATGPEVIAEVAPLIEEQTSWMEKAQTDIEPLFIPEPYTAQDAMPFVTSVTPPALVQIEPMDDGMTPLENWMAIENDMEDVPCEKDYKFIRSARQAEISAMSDDMMDTVLKEEPMPNISILFEEQKEEGDNMVITPQAPLSEATPAVQEEGVVQAKQSVADVDAIEDLFEDAENYIVSMRIVIAKPQDSYASIANRYNVNEAKLAQSNHHKMIYERSLVVLPLD